MYISYVGPKPRTISSHVLELTANLCLSESMSSFLCNCYNDGTNVHKSFLIIFFKIFASDNIPLLIDDSVKDIESDVPIILFLLNGQIITFDDLNNISVFSRYLSTKAINLNSTADCFVYITLDRKLIINLLFL